MSRFCVLASWWDVPHLDEATRQELLLSIPPYQRDARSRGIPQLGSGAIYPIPESDMVVPDRSIPDHWPRCYGLDVGWNRTAALWLAQDPDTQVIYAWSEHYMGREEPAIHASSIRGRGAWIPGVIDPSARGRSQKDGNMLLQNYVDLGLDLEPAVAAVEAGLFTCWTLLSSGMLKIFDSLHNLRQEMRLYRRDEKGHVVKENDHACDAMRYAIVSGRDRMRTKPVEKKKETVYVSPGGQSTEWMG